jgi:hypothetical protein
MTARGIRIPNKDWEMLEKLSNPENVSILVRKIIREYLSTQKTI